MLILKTAVLLLMLSIGMSLSLRQLIETWQKLTPSLWIRLLAATFIIPPLLALALGSILPIGAAATAGLFLVAVAPGAPLMTRGVSSKGFDRHIVASYQVWGAVLAPLMIPLLVAGGSVTAFANASCGETRARQPASGNRRWRRRLEGAT